MDKRTVVITGGNSGLGYQCAKNIALESKNYTVILACRNRDKARTAVENIQRETGNPNIYTISLDLSSVESIYGFCEELKSNNFPPLYSLVCNAGINGGTAGLTKEGFDIIFGVCHLGHFLLANLLVNYMLDDGRILFVSSDMHNPPKLFSKTMPRFTSAHELAYPETKSQEVPAMLRYSMAKLCNILCAYEMSERLAKETKKHITVNAFNPGLMTDTNFMSMTTNKVVRVVAKGLMTVFATVIGVLGSSVKSGKSLAALVTD